MLVGQPERHVRTRVVFADCSTHSCLPSATASVVTSVAQAIASSVWVAASVTMISDLLSSLAPLLGWVHHKQRALLVLLHLLLLWQLQQ